MAEAKKALQNLSVPDHSGKLRKVTFVELENGKIIPVNISLSFKGWDEK